MLEMMKHANKMQEAIDYLTAYAGNTISEVYDDDCVSDAILILHPDFEYPDWDSRKVAELIKDRTEHLNHAFSKK